MKQSPQQILDSLKAEGFDTAYRYEDIQSGNVSYSLSEPDHFEYSQYFIKEVSIDDVPLYEVHTL